jgi:hypothetical protein
MSVQDTSNIVPKLVQEVSVPDVDTSPITGAIGVANNILDDDDEQEVIRREFTPNVVTRLGGTLPWDTKSTQLQCGETVTDANGDMNFRLVYHCVATQTEFETLLEMRNAPQTIRLVSAAYTGPVTFDELKFDRVTDENGTVVRGEGLNEEPKYTIQLQSKEESEDDEETDLIG